LGIFTSLLLLVVDGATLVGQAVSPVKPAFSLMPQGFSFWNWRDIIAKKCLIGAGHLAACWL
jgi:hypothetical protein